VPREQYVASDINPLYLQTLQGLTADRPYLDVTLTDVTRGETFPRPEGGFDTVVCLNVVEHVADDVGALLNIGSVLAPGGRAIVLVPQGPEVFGTLDEVLGHHRRYTVETLTKLAADAGFTVKELVHFNRVGRPAWWLNGKVLERRDFGLMQIMALNLLTPIFRLIDKSLPFDALSLIAVMEKVEPAAAHVPPAAQAKVPAP
jgi:SAM-dependent methyltransferase